MGTDAMKAALRVLLVDDEPLARLRLRTLLGAQTAVPTEVVGEAGDTEAALALLQQVAPVDLLLVDIRMPGRDGLRLARVLRTLAQPPAVVFVTAHAEHALTAFELEALDYLTKPVRSERLLAALQRAWARQRPADSANAPLTDGPVLVVADRGRVLRLPLAEVLYLKAELKYVTLRTAGSSHLLDESLSELEQRLHALGSSGRIGATGVTAEWPVARAPARLHADRAPAGTVPQSREARRRRVFATPTATRPSAIIR